MRTFREWLGDRRIYLRQIEWLHARHLGSPQLNGLSQDGVSLATMVQQRQSLSRLLARTVASGEYRSGPAERRVIEVKGKERTVFSYRLVDSIVHGAVAQVIDRLAAPERSERLYSYQRGRSSWRAVAAFAEFVRRTRAATVEPTERHLYVLRRDVRAYTDSIPLGAGAPMWQMLEELLGPLTAPERRLLESVVRPDVVTSEGTTRLETGLPMGQPISGVLANFYLGELDRLLEQVAGGFYARYCDDFLFAHPDAAVAMAVSALIDSTLARLGLCCHADKKNDIYLTPAARPSEAWPSVQRAAHVPFLGTQIAATGTVALDRAKARRLLRDISVRTRRTARLLPAQLSEKQRGRVICAVPNRCLDPEAAPIEQQTSAALVRRVVTDRPQLAQLDYQVARIVVGALYGGSGVRGFRRFPYRRLRDEWGLLSLEHARNQWGKGRRAHESR